jgi:hypothetical protein
MRPSGVLTRFMVATGYQVSDKYTTQKELLMRFVSNSCDSKVRSSRHARDGQRSYVGPGRLDVAAAPLELLPDYAEE